MIRDTPFPHHLPISEPSSHNKNILQTRKRIGKMATERISTSKAILAVNGFAADGNNFVKRVKQRLEVSFGGFSLYLSF